MIFYKRSQVRLDGHGNQNISPKDQWGQRSVDFAFLTHLKSGRKIDVFNTHWCVCGAHDLLKSAKETIEAFFTKFAFQKLIFNRIHNVKVDFLTF